MGVFSYCVFVCLYVWLRISQRRKKIVVWNFACLFDYYPGWASPILVNCGSRGVMAGALLPGCTHRRIGATRQLLARLGIGCLGLARWCSRNWGSRRHVRPYGGICVLQACRRTFFCFFLPAFFFSYYRLDLNFVYNWSYIFTGRMALMSPKQQNQSTNGSSKYQLQPGKITNTGLSFLDPQTDSRQSALFCVWTTTNFKNYMEIIHNC